MTSELNSLRHWLISWFFFTASIRYLAEWMVNGYPSENVWPLDLKRFGTLQSSRTFLRHRVMEVMRKWGLCVQCSPGCPRLALCCAVCPLSTVTTLRNIVLPPGLPWDKAVPSQEKAKAACFVSSIPASFSERDAVGRVLFPIYLCSHKEEVCVYLCRTPA